MYPAHLDINIYEIIFSLQHKVCTNGERLQIYGALTRNITERGYRKEKTAQIL